MIVEREDACDVKLNVKYVRPASQLVKALERAMQGFQASRIVVPFRLLQEASEQFSRSHSCLLGRWS